MSFRRLWVLLKRLPMDSWTQTELRDSTPDSELIVTRPQAEPERFGPWALEHYLLANLIDAVKQNTYLFAVVNSREGKEPPPPAPTPRPGANRSKVRALTPADLRKGAYLNALRASG